MLKNYFKIALRNALRSPGFTVVNVLGLSLGIGSCLLISLFVKDELSFDKYLQDGDKIYRVITQRSYVDRSQHSAQVPVPFGETLEGRFVGVEDVLEVSGIREMLFETNGEKFYEGTGLYTSTAFFNFFDTEFLLGSPEKALAQPSSLVLTEKVAIKYFGEDWIEKDVLSKTLKLNNDKEYSITAVISNSPQNFHLSYNYLIPLSDK